MGKGELQYAYISGPRDINEYLDAGRYLGTMGYIPMNMFTVGFDNVMITDREKRLEKVRNCDMVFLLEGWRDCPDAVDEYEEAVFYNREHERQIAISHPEFRG